MIATVIFISVTSMIRRLANFVSVYQGNVTTSLTSSTDSVGWQDPIIVSDKVNSLNFTDLGLASAVNQFALVWVNGSIEIEYAYENNGQASLPAWNLPASVSEKTEAGSYQPQVALGSDGYGYITWEDGGTIWYNMCRGIPAKTRCQ
jgi:hypothetical protein